MTTDNQTPTSHDPNADLELDDLGVAMRAIATGIEIPAPRKLDRAKVYICHPYSNEPYWNIQYVTIIAKAIVRCLPHVTVIAPQLMLPAYIDDTDQRDHAMAMCIDLALACDEIWVCSEKLSEGMRRELEAVGPRSITIRCFESYGHVVARLDAGDIDPATVRPLGW